MDWKYIAARVSCPECKVKYTISFWMKGLVPCLSFICRGCNGRYMFRPPNIEEKVCAACKRRIDCLVNPPFIVSRFLVNERHVEIWKHDSQGVKVSGEIRDCHFDDIRIDGW